MRPLARRPSPTGPFGVNLVLEWPQQGRLETCLARESELFRRSGRRKSEHRTHIPRAPRRSMRDRTAHGIACDIGWPDAPHRALRKGRTRGPVFVTHRKPAPARSSARATSARAPDSRGCRTGRLAPCSTLIRHWPACGGWDLHEWRHSGLTHLGEAGASLPMLSLNPWTGS
jgi:hypothetical protein